MLVILTQENVLSAQTVCQDCLLADHQGLPRWKQGTLGCRSSLDKNLDTHQPKHYQCQMGFQIVEVE
ncbi:hypothetical protein [Cyanobacterium sp. uoEpiScrs1]|uniref:hypothetical protein n=1 Tax=Cyanobacterium sp. uoEpiScrs1 TaxID=2976343 RepID=UPI00226A74BB|nr:hypothetical protein [Cyanobacterium sp. uoEpiScrs1]